MRKLGVAALAVVSLAFGHSVPSADAAPLSGSLYFVVRMSTSVGIGHAVLWPPAQGSFYITTTILCVGGAARTDANPVASVGCGMSASGEFYGNCELWSATVTGTVQFPNVVGTTETVSFSANIQQAAYKFVMIGTATRAGSGETGPMFASGALTPDSVTSPWPESCATGWQRDLFAMGVASFSTI